MFLFLIASTQAAHVFAKNDSVPSNTFELNERIHTQGAISYPNHISQSTKQKQVKAYFEYWQNKYLRTLSTENGKSSYYIFMQGVGPDGENSITTSEAHGYGMMIFVQLADYSKSAKTIFDGMVLTYNRFRSTKNIHNMSWMIRKDSSRRYGSATDGDMDIANALLLAHKKWGSSGEYNYLALAKNIIQKGIKISDFNRSGRPNLGDWDRDAFNTRSSDWMPSHFQSFYKYTQDNFWLSAITTVYQMASHIQKNYSPKSGLLPDFVIANTPQPAPKNFLDEGTVDFSWNACRYPFRLTLDYALHDRQEAKVVLEKSLSWLVKTTEGYPERIKAGYYLNGQPQVSYISAAFTAPWIVAATTDAKYQKFINRGWDQILKMKYDYYSDSISLLGLIYLSGQWIKP